MDIKLKINKISIGDWISCVDGYAQLTHIRKFYKEEFEEERDYAGKYKLFVIYKLFCSFKGRHYKKNIIKVCRFQDCSKVTSEEKFFIDSIIDKNRKQYENFLFYDDFLELSNKILLEFNCPISEFENVSKVILKVRNKLLPFFTYDQFKEEIEKHKLPFKLSESIPYGYVPFNSNDSLSIILNNRLFKVIDKKKVFDWVKVSFPVPPVSPHL